MAGSHCTCEYVPGGHCGLSASEKLGRFYSGKVRNNRVCTTGFLFWIVNHYLFSFNYRAIMLLWNRACRFHCNSSLNWLFVNAKVSTMTWEMKQKHSFYINLILLFPPILSQSGFLDIPNLLQWFPWQLLFIVVPPRTPVIRKFNFAKGSGFAFHPLLCSGRPEQLLCFLLSATPSPQLQPKARAGSTQRDVIKPLGPLSQPKLPFWALLHTTAYRCTHSNRPSERWGTHSYWSPGLQNVAPAVVSKPTK